MSILGWYLRLHSPIPLPSALFYSWSWNIPLASLDIECHNSISVFSRRYSMGIFTPFTSPRDSRWHGFQHHHHSLFLIKNVILLLFIILVIVEYALFISWWNQKSDTSLEYAPWVSTYLLANPSWNHSLILRQVFFLASYRHRTDSRSPLHHPYSYPNFPNSYPGP